MRLIDADRFLEYMTDKCDMSAELDPIILGIFRGALKEQPTAYSVDKVVEELEKAKYEIPSEDYCRSINDKEKCDGRNCFECCAEYLIEIVKQEAEKFGTDINVGSNGNGVLKFANLLKELCCKKDEDYDNPVISPKYLNDTIENLLLDYNEKNNNGWIPCSEQLPKEDEKVYISTKTERVYVGVYTKRYGFEKREGFICDDGFMWMNTALAWKPYVLPAPYQPKGE